MKLGFEGRALMHDKITGVERYSIEVLRGMERLLGSDMEVLKPNFKNRYYHHLWEYSVLPYMAIKNNLDVLFCPTGAAPFNLNKKIKLAVTVHDIAFVTHPEMFSGLFGEYYRKVTPKILDRADVIFAVSNNEKSVIEATFKQSIGKVVTVYEAASEKFKNHDLPREKYILAVASLNKNKNLPSLLRAFKLLLDRIPHTLILVGGNRDIISADESISQLIQELPEERVKMTGYVSDNDLVKYYNISELFVFPSYYEGFGIPPLEAMACGCPVLAARSSSLPEICSDAAEYVDPDDIEGMSNKIYELLSNDIARLDLIRKGYKRSSEFTWNTTSSKIYQHLVDCVGDK